MLDRIASGLYRIRVPFEDIYTGVFAVTVGDRYVIVDSATTDSDVDTVILPALRSIGLDGAPEALLLSHHHGDHAGGARRLAEVFSGLRIYAPREIAGTEVLPLTDGMIFLGRLRAVMLPGHTDSSFGFLDSESGTLLSCDCLQQRGVSRYTNGVKHEDLYRASIGRIRDLPLQRIVASHEYVPLGAVAEGREEICRYLDECLRALA